MSDNKAIIPIYLNSPMASNLFTIVIQEFAQSKSILNKNQTVINIKTPLSEFSYDLFGKFIQGDITIQHLNEFSKQKNEALISKDIFIFYNLRKILIENKMLKVIDNNFDINTLKENDFIVFNSRIYNNPIFSYFQRIINVLEMQTVFENNSPNKRSDDLNVSYSDQKSSILKKLKTDIESIKSCSCQKYIAKNIKNTGMNAVIPLTSSNIIENQDYLTLGNINVIGKVTNLITEQNADGIDLLSGSYFDYIDSDYFTNFRKNYLNDSPLIEDFDTEMLKSKPPTMEILPIALYI